MVAKAVHRHLLVVSGLGFRAKDHVHLLAFFLARCRGMNAESYDGEGGCEEGDDGGKDGDDETDNYDEHDNEEGE